MILSAHQPAYLPWLGYFNKIFLCDKFIILDGVQFEKNSFINRNKIKTPNGELWLTVPLLTKGHMQKQIKDVKINNQVKWREDHWKSIFYNYKKAPFFCDYSDFFEDLYKRQWDSIVELSYYILVYILKELNIDKEIEFQSKINVFSANQELILDICKYYKADKFIFGQEGSNYADEKIFKENNIEICFQKYEHPKYEQLWGEFSPYMSIIDLLFNVEKTKIVDMI